MTLAWLFTTFLQLFLMLQLYSTLLQWPSVYNYIHVMTGIKKHTQSRETCKSRHVYMNSKLFLLFKFVLLLFYHLIISTSCPKKQGTKMSDTISHKKKLQYPFLMLQLSLLQWLERSLYNYIRYDWNHTSHLHLLDILGRCKI